ncbi:MAG: hypothetical protein OCD01_20190 [Fibrobacterales bacterium]
MSCCSDTNCTPQPGKSKACPTCNNQAKGVELKTVRLHVKKPWATHLAEENYYYCKTLSCPTVYFNDSGAILTQQDLRRTIGVKDTTSNRQICYCYNVTLQDLLDEDAAGNTGAIKHYVASQSKAGTCACDVNNPSGKCCLVDFPKEIVLPEEQSTVNEE